MHATHVDACARPSREAHTHTRRARTHGLARMRVPAWLTRSPPHLCRAVQVEVAKGPEVAEEEIEYWFKIMQEKCVARHPRALADPAHPLGDVPSLAAVPCFALLAEPEVGRWTPRARAAG